MSDPAPAPLAALRPDHTAPLACRHRPTHRAAGHHLDAAHPAVRKTLRSIARRHGVPQRRAVALATLELRKLVAACDGSLAGLRDRACFYAATPPHSARASWRRWRSRTCASPATAFSCAAAQQDRPRGQHAATCPVRALKVWLQASGIRFGPAFY